LLGPARRAFNSVKIEWLGPALLFFNYLQIEKLDPTLPGNLQSLERRHFMFARLPRDKPSIINK
jgi:hypothetical protein